jgi:hypothetical protein
MHGVDNLLARSCVKPGTVGAAARTDFGHDHQIIGIRMQRLLNDLIGYMRTVEITGIDVVHSRRDCLAKNRDRTGNIARRPPHSLVAVLSSELHRPITHTIYIQRSARLVHLMRDINEDLCKQPFNEEIRDISRKFAALLRLIVESVDRFGLKTRHLRKHRPAVDGFFKEILGRVYKTEVATGYPKTICEES